MIALGIVDILARATALIAIAAIVQALFHRRGSAAARHLVWASVLAGLPALPLAEAALTHWDVAIPIPVQTAPATDDLIPATPASLDALADSVPAPRASFALGAPESSPLRESSVPGWIALVVAIYAAGLVLLIARLGLELIVLRRLARAARETTDTGWLRLLDDATRQLRIARGVRLLQSADEIVPITFGTRRPVVMVPASSNSWTDDRRRAVLLHELAHVARHDCFTQLLSAIACAMYWPHPGVWWAARRLRVERELACDDRVITAGTEPREYAGHLLELARSLGSAPAPTTALAMARVPGGVGQLEHRLLAILDAARNRAALPRRGGLVAIAASIALLLPIAALRAAVMPVERVALPSIVSAAIDTQDFSGTWELRLSADGASAHLSLRTAHGSHGETMPTAQLEALTGARIAGTSGAVRFPIRRDAGTFAVEGICRGNVCAGTYAFEPNAGFAAELAKRGIGAPTPTEQFQLAAQDVGFAFLDELSRNGYAKPDIKGLVTAAQHGVGTEYVREMATLGYRLRTLGALVGWRDHGIDPNYVRGMASNGFARLSADELVRARDHGVDPTYVKGMRDLGFRSLDLAGLLNARDHGIDPSYASGLAALGYRNLPLNDLLGARDHGVDPEYIRGMQDLGYKGLQLDALIRLRDHGVDPAYVRGLAALGYKEMPLDTLVRMRDHGVDPNYVQRLKQKGLDRLTVDQLIERRDRGTDDPSVAAKDMLTAFQSLWKSLVVRLRN